MAGWRPPSPGDQANAPQDVRDGTTALQPMPAAGLTCDSSYWRKMRYVHRAWVESGAYTNEAIIRETGYDFMQIIEGLLQGLLAAVGIVALATILGALIGAGIGALAAGAGAAPGAAIGARLGFRFGLWLLEWLGVAFLILYIAEHLERVGHYVNLAVGLAANSCGNAALIDLAARQFATAIGVFFSLLIQAVLVYLTREAASGRFGAAIQRLRTTRLFKACERLEAWLNENYVRLMFRYKIKSEIVVLGGEGAVAGPRVAQGLATARGLLERILARGRPQFKNVAELDEALRGQGFKLTKNEPFGPDHPDARQLIYEGPNSVIVKVKTMGYKNGMRKGGTLSVEVTDGKGSGWDNTLFKLDAQGKVVAKNLVGEQQVVSTADGFQIQAPDGKLRPISPFEVLEGGGAKPVDKNLFADKGHLDFAPGFDPKGAAKVGTEAPTPK